MQLKLREIFVYLNLLLLSITFVSHAKTKIEYLDTFFPNVSVLKGVEGYASLSLPFPDRYIAKDFLLHLEVSKSRALVPERSGISIFFNGKLVYQTMYPPKVDNLSLDIPIPPYLVKRYNKIEIKTTQHYCVNCCEYEKAPELWTKIYWDRSYVKVNYKRKEIKPNLLYLRDYVLDEKQYNPIRYTVITENKSDKMLTFAAKIAGFIGSYIKYRKIYVSYTSNINPDTDNFIIGTKDFIRKVLKLKPDSQVPDVLITPNPYDNTRAIVAISANTYDELDNIINAFISLKKSIFFGKSLYIKRFKKFSIKPYQSPKFIPPDEKIHLSDLGYTDVSFYGFYPPPFDIRFTIPVDYFLAGKDKFVFNLFYNYGSGVRDDSVINIFINDKFLTQLKIDKNYGTILENKKLLIPVYMLKPGENKLTIQYALMPRNQGFCVAPNVNALQGTVFAKKTYIQIPDLPHWVEMPHMEFFTMQAYPYSIYPDLKDTEILLSNLDENTISSMLTLVAYIGEKTEVSPYNLEVTTDEKKLDKSKNLILIGYMFKPELFENMPISIQMDKITIKYSIFKEITDLLKKQILGKKETENLRALLEIRNKLKQEVIFTMGQSPYTAGKTIFMILSKKPEEIYKAIKLLYEPKYTGNIKGDLAVVDFKNSNIYWASLGEKYYVGNLSFIDYFLYWLGYTSPWIIIIAVIFIILLLIFILKIRLDIRERRRKRGEI